MSAPGAGIDPEAAGGHRWDYARECGFGDRGWSRFRGRDFGSSTGAAQISRGIFSRLEVKSGGFDNPPAGEGEAPSRQPAGRRRYEAPER